MTTHDTRSETEDDVADARRWWGMVPLAVGFFLIMLDSTIVNVAVPTIRTDLGANLNAAVWINSAYLLAYAVPLILTGRLGDRVDRRTLFLVGLVGFAAASAWCGMASSIGELLTARVIQGLAAATMAPQSMAIITTLFRREELGTPIGIWGAVGSTGLAAGPVLGGGIIAALDWRWIFWLNIPLVVIAVVLAVKFLPSTTPSKSGRLDVVGALLATVALLALIFGLQNGEQFDWGDVVGPIGIVHILVVGVAAAAAFVWWERTTDADPLVPPRLVRAPRFAASIGVVFALGFAATGMMLPILLYLNEVRGISTLAAALWIAPQAVLAGVVGAWAGHRSERTDPGLLVRAGCLVFALGIAVAAVSIALDKPPAVVMIGLVLCGIGGGAAFSPLMTVALSSAPPEVTGASAGVYNSARQVGSVAGSAAAGLVMQLALPGTAGGPALWQSLIVPAVVLTAGAALASILVSKREAVSA